MSFLNLLFKDIVKFAAENDLDLVWLVKFIDYVFASVTVDHTKEVEVQSYVTNSRILNHLYMLLGIATHYNDSSRTAYSEEKLIHLLDHPEDIAKMQAWKLKIHRAYNADLIPLFDQYRGDKF